MNMKMMIALAALAMSGTTHAITSEEIANALDESFAIEGVGISCGDGVQWVVDSGVHKEGVSSLRSGVIGHSQSTATLSLSVTNDVVFKCEFWYKTSTEADCDPLVVSADGITQLSLGGERGWNKYTLVLLPGSHTISWIYRKDGSGVRGSDCVWIDGLTVCPVMAPTSKVNVENIKCQQRYPWNGMVDIDYTVTSDDPDADVWVYPIGYDKDSNTSMAPRALTGDGVNAPVKAGTHRMTWTVTEDYPDFHSTAFTVKMIALVGAAPYMVVDLSGGVDAISYPVSYLSSVPEGGWSDEYKTTKLVLRLIPPGSFMMGSPSDESGRSSYEDLHGVVLTKPFYIGVFEVTQKQYQLVMGANPSSRKGDMRPVEQVSYNNIRGSVNGAGWPTHNQVDANSFMGRLRSKVNMLFDLPTEAQWEYACRAGTTAALNSGKSYDGGNNCNEVARWNGNRSDGKGGYTDYTTKVGSYRENMWGLYDMHGNIWELCRDFFNGGLGSAGVIDPKGASTGYWGANRSRSRRGGWAGDGSAIRSAFRDSYQDPGIQDAGVGFRVFCSPVAE
ncbi:MAG: formylglycine-generating enzyme family protein [Lentisphaerae bacterium]|nr:formylglycine-generating enzyme family protein [Lentisphaerota bacterium]